jgi:hypothetical protein
MLKKSRVVDDLAQIASASSLYLPREQGLEQREMRKIWIIVSSIIRQFRNVTVTHNLLYRDLTGEAKEIARDSPTPGLRAGRFDNM